MPQFRVRVNALKEQSMSTVTLPMNETSVPDAVEQSAQPKAVTAMSGERQRIELTIVGVFSSLTAFNQRYPNVKLKKQIENYAHYAAA